MREHGHEDEIEALYSAAAERDEPAGWLEGRRAEQPDVPVPEGDAWEAVAFDPTDVLGFHPDATARRLEETGSSARAVWTAFAEWIWRTPVTKDEYTWEHYKWEYFYEDDGRLPRDENGALIEFDPAEALGFEPASIEARLDDLADRAEATLELEDRRTVDVNPDIDEDDFFSSAEGETTLVNRYDLEKAVSMDRKLEFTEVERYWVNEPHAFVIIFHSAKENEEKYYLVTPYLNEIEADLVDFLSGKLRTVIRNADEAVGIATTPEERAAVLEREIEGLLDRYDLRSESTSILADVRERIESVLGDGDEPAPEPPNPLDGIAARPEPVVVEEDSETLTPYQVQKLLHVLIRDFIGYERIDGIKHDVNVEDISCDGYDQPVFVYHTEYENLITNVRHGRTQLDNFVIKLAQRSGKGISKRRPQVDATLPDGSRAQLTLGEEVSDHGTNYTIRQFNDVPFTPIDLINWNTFSLDQMAFLWLAIENNKSIIFAGGTASGKTTTLNAASLFIPSNTKIVSIEDTREVELPQRNWIASITRPSFTDDDTGNVDEFDLLETALRQRPEYIAMGEVRGEEGRTLFQVMSTGHTTVTTFHADSIGEVLKRFTTDPINVSKTMFTGVDLVCVQTQTRVQGRKVRRAKTITEVNHYDAENDEINVQDVYKWHPESDSHRQNGVPNTLDDITFDQGWSDARLDEERAKRKAVLAYLIENDLTEYAQVAATLQAFMKDPDTVLALMARGSLERSLENLREMESIGIDVQPEKEALVPRPTADEEMRRQVREVLAEAEERFLAAYETVEPSPLVSALSDVRPAEDVVVEPSTDPAEPEPVAGNGSDAEPPSQATSDDHESTTMNDSDLFADLLDDRDRLDDMLDDETNDPSSGTTSDDESTSDPRR
nr:type II/IV secretion system ATPase subunit [Halanaeroarchaeum sp. HSR-CO]